MLMLRRPLHRLITTLLVVLSLLWAQLALASYACPGASDVASMAAMVGSGAPCHGMDEQQPALCHGHAAPDAASAETPKWPVLQQPVLMHLPALRVVREADQPRPLPRFSSPDTRPPPGRVFLSTLRLRV
jgi:hypothetical protein